MDNLLTDMYRAMKTTQEDDFRIDNHCKASFWWLQQDGSGKCQALGNNAVNLFILILSNLGVNLYVH